MSDTTHPTDPSQDRLVDADPAVALHATVVQYSDRPDRCTVYPGHLDHEERLCTWLSADQEAFVPLADAR